MEDLQAALQSILSDPAQMARVAALAESLGLKPPEEGAATGGYEAAGNRQQAAGEPRDGTAGAASSAFPLPGLDGPELGRLLGLLSASSGSEDRLLNALRPALSAAGQARIDRALRAAKLSRLAGGLLRQGRSAHV